MNGKGEKILLFCATDGTIIRMCRMSHNSAWGAHVLPSVCAVLMCVTAVVLK